LADLAKGFDLARTMVHLR